MSECPCSSIKPFQNGFILFCDDKGEKIHKFIYEYIWLEGHRQQSLSKFFGSYRENMLNFKVELSSIDIYLSFAYLP